MGRGNVCTLGKYEGLWCIDYENLTMYRTNEPDVDGEYYSVLGKDIDDLDDYHYDEIGTDLEIYDLEESLCTAFAERFTGFSDVRSHKHWLTWMRDNAEGKVLLESKLFYIVEEDNQWSLAIKVIQKHDPYGDYLDGLQKKHYMVYLDWIKNFLLDRFGEVSYNNGAWMSGTIRKEDITQ